MYLNQKNQTTTTMQIRTYSKINIYLKVCGKKDNGYHLIETIFLPLAEPYDIVSLDISSDYKKITVSSDSNLIPLDRNNICVKAAELYAEQTRIKPTWHFHIEKNIPISAGLGGGSGNAAGALNLLNTHYKKLSEKQLLELAAKIGADVPFFLNPSFAAAKGIGEQISKINIKTPNCPILLINPRFPVSAAWAYNNIEYHPNHNYTSQNDTVTEFCNGNFKKLNEIFCNDLQPATFKKFPILQLLQSFLIEHNASFSAMSGSGPTLFSLFPDNTTMNTTTANLIEHFSESITIIKAKPLI